MFPPPDEALAGKEVSRSTDFDEFKSVLNEHFYPANVEPLAAEGPLVEPLLSVAHLRRSTIGLVHFAGRVSVDPGDLGSYHVNVPLRGSVLSYCGQEAVMATPLKAVVFTPGRRTFLPDWDGQSPQWCWKIDRAALEQEMESLLGKAVPGRIDFDLPFDLSTPGGQRWLETLKLMISYANELGNSPAAALHVENLERSLISGLLLTHRHSQLADLELGGGPPRPRTVCSVINALHEDLGKSYTLGDLCAIAGVSARQLQYAFRESTGLTPLEYLRQARLDWARRMLVTTPLPITEVAFECGFNHLGKFSKYYQDRFGETPSGTRSGLVR